MYSIRLAAKGEIRIEPNQDRRAYDRDDDHFYPYRSHGQYLRAWYGLLGCSIFVVFNGWRSVISPMSNADFVAAYINIPVLVILIVIYRVKLEGFNPLKWTRRANQELRRPISVSQRNPRLRRGRLRRARKDVLFCRENAERFVHWLWTWLK